MTRVNGHSKGGRGERAVAAIIQKWWQRYERKADFLRTPMSGGWRKDTDARIHFNACGDLMTTGSKFPFCVEVKWREQWSVNNLLAGKPTPPWSWWLQCLKAANEQGAVPMMWMRKNRIKDSSAAFPWLVWLPLQFVEKQQLGLVPDVQWSSAKLEKNGVDYGGVLPVMYDYTRFVDFSPRRMIVGV